MLFSSLLCLSSEMMGFQAQGVGPALKLDTVVRDLVKLTKMLHDGTSLRGGSSQFDISPAARERIQLTIKNFSAHSQPPVERVCAAFSTAVGNFSETGTIVFVLYVASRLKQGEISKWTKNGLFPSPWTYMKGSSVAQWPWSSDGKYKLTFDTIRMPITYGEIQIRGAWEQLKLRGFSKDMD